MHDTRRRFLAVALACAFYAAGLLCLTQSAGASPPAGYTRVTYWQDGTTTPDIAPGTGWGSPADWHRLTAHTPYGGDFGDAYFSGPQDAADGRSPFSIDAQGNIVITAWLDPTINHWRSGLLSTIGWDGQGFAQTYGYFECRMKMPATSPGCWTAFWLCSVPGIYKNDLPRPEIDVIEWTSQFPTLPWVHLHLWSSTGGYDQQLTTPDLSDDFHNYGVLVEKDYVTFYFDDQAVGWLPTPNECKQPLYMMVDLALGSGGYTPEDKQLLIDHIAAYAGFSF